MTAPRRATPFATLGTRVGRAFVSGPLLRIRSAADLWHVIQAARARRFLRRGTLELALAELPEPDRGGWEKVLNATLRNCGCGMGAGFALAAFAGSLLQLARVQSLSLAVVAATGFFALVAAVLAGALGKLLGLWLAKRRFIRSGTQLLEQLGHLATPASSVENPGHV